MRPTTTMFIATLMAGSIACGTITGCATSPSNGGANVSDSSSSAGQASSDGDSNATVSDTWYANLPRKSWSQFEQVDVSDVTDWFTVYKLPGNVYAIYDGSQFEENICYLIIGKDKAVLLDTGGGFSSIRKVTDKLTDLPVTVVLTHTHHDHMGGMHEYDDVIVYDSDEAVERATTGKDEYEDITYEAEPEALRNGLPDGLDSADDYKIQGKAPTGTVKDGDTIDLGDRQLQVVWTPGHTGDSICLVDRANGLLFTGDTYYPANLYAFSADADLKTYDKSMHKLADMISGMNLQWIYPGHNEIVKGTGVIGEVAEDMDQILSGEKNEYTVGDDGYRYYSFGNDITIVTENKDLS